MAANDEQDGYHVMSAVGAESQLGPLLTLACSLAAPREGRVTLLSVTVTGRRPAWLQLASEQGERSPRASAGDSAPAEVVSADDASSSGEAAELPAACAGVPLRVVVRGGRYPADEILAAARDDPPDLLLLSWQGDPGGGRYL